MFKSDVETTVKTIISSIDMLGKTLKLNLTSTKNYVLNQFKLMDLLSLEIALSIDLDQ